MFEVAFCVSGQGRTFRAAVRNAAITGAQVRAVFVEATADPELEHFCAKYNVRYVKVSGATRQDFDAELTRQCRDADVDLLCLTFDKLLPSQLVSAYRGRIINLHPGLLPAFPGMHAITRCLQSGARFAGATVHEVDEGMDSGNIIAQCITPISGDDDVHSLGKRLYRLMEPMLLQVIAWYAQGRMLRGTEKVTLVEGAVYGELPTSPAIELPNLVQG